MSIKIENEVKVESEPCVIAWNEKLFVGSEDGSIKVSKKLFTDLLSSF